jgi:amino acid transporter
VIGGRRPLSGRKLADRRVRVERPHAPYFRYTGPGQLVAREAASMPTTASGRILARLKKFAIGRPLASEEEIGERLSKKKALAIFSSDPISSSAYATEEILRVLLIAGGAALILSNPISIAIALMLGIVSISYRQICYAYPSGGGAYVVSRENLSQRLALVAAAALLVDYVLTVAVSSASAIAQIVSVVPSLHVVGIEIGVVSIMLMTLANLRGVRESGNIFAVPTYLFLGMALVMIAIGVGRIVTGNAAPLPPNPQAVPLGTEPLGLFLILRAFASGSVALTGTEAVTNGVPAFQPPEAKNAANTLIIVSVLLGILFVGISVVADAFGIRPTDTEHGGPTVIAQVASTIFGPSSPLYFIFQGSTALLLFLAANTSFNAFPRLAAILGEDGFMPRQFSFRGDRLAFSYGIVALAAVAACLIVIFNGDTHALIPLYSVGVFVTFTLSQTGMVIHWRRVRPQGWQWRALINGAGAVLTAVVLVVVASVKFADGAYLVVILIPILVLVMLFINRQYRSAAGELAVRPDFVARGPHREERAVVPVPTINRAVIQAVNVARSISDDVRAVYIAEDPNQAASMRKRWERQVPGVPLVVVESPYRALVGPLLAYLDVLDRAWPPDKDEPITFVVIPEYVARHWWERALYNQSARRLRTALLGRPYTVIVNVPYRREEAIPLSEAVGGSSGTAAAGQGEAATEDEAAGGTTASGRDR